MEYFHKERPDVVPQVTICSMAGLASTIPEDECVDDVSTPSPHTPTTSPATSTESGLRSGRRVTALGVLQAIAERQEDRKDIDGQKMTLLARALGQDKGSTAERFAGADEQFGIAMSYLGLLETHEDIEDDEDAMYVVKRIADVVHGSERGPAQRMTACVWALAKRDLPVARAVGRLRALLPVRVVADESGSGSGSGGFIR